eukprot:scaffold7921_cov68-Cyclotella_meneghiniana.AAC.7
MSRHLHLGHPARLHGQLSQVMPDVIRQCLGVGRTARSAAPNVIVQLGDLVGGAVGDVGAGADARVGAEDDAVGEGDGHDGGARGEFVGFEIAGFGRFAGVGVV